MLSQTALVLADSLTAIARLQFLRERQNAPVGASVYLVIGDGADLASSTDFAVFDPGLVFGTENAVGAGALDIIIDSDALTADSLVYGTIAHRC